MVDQLKRRAFMFTGIWTAVLAFFGFKSKPARGDNAFCFDFDFPLPPGICPKCTADASVTTVDVEVELPLFAPGTSYLGMTTVDHPQGQTRPVHLQLQAPAAITNITVDVYNRWPDIAKGTPVHVITGEGAHTGQLEIAACAAAGQASPAKSEKLYLVIIGGTLPNQHTAPHIRPLILGEACAAQRTHPGATFVRFPDPADPNYYPCPSQFHIDHVMFVGTRAEIIAFWAGRVHAACDAMDDWDDNMLSVTAREAAQTGFCPFRDQIVPFVGTDHPAVIACNEQLRKMS